MEILLIVFIFLILFSLYSSLESKGKASAKVPANISLNVLHLPDLSTLKCENCGNDKIGYRCLDSYTFDINCNKCGSVVWENPDREKRIQQIESMLD